MTNNDVTTVIDAEKCIGCGKCVEVCPARTLPLVDGKAAVTGKRSIQCGHCEAICPAGAIRVEALDPEAFRFETVKVDERWLPPGESDVAALLRLMRSLRKQGRRCRAVTPGERGRPRCSRRRRRCRRSGSRRRWRGG